MSKGRSLRGNVDRNLTLDISVLDDDAVVPYVGTWIEIKRDFIVELGFSGRSLRGNVDRNSLAGAISQPNAGRSLRGNVDRNCAAR